MTVSQILRTGVVVPEEYSADIIQATIRSSAVMQLARRVPMGTLIEHIPVMSALPTAGFVNPRDTGKKPLTSAAWQGIILTAEEIACIVPIPLALVEDANFDIFGEVQPRVAEAMGAVIDAACLFGTGAPSSWPVGGLWLNAYDADNRVVKGTTPGGSASIDVADDINNVMAQVEADGFDVNGFVGTTSLKASLRGLRSSQGVPIFQPSLTAGTPGTLYGENITYSRNNSFDLTKALLFAGDWSMAALGIRQDIRIQVLEESTFTNGDGTVALSLGEQDMVALRCYMRLGFAIANPTTIANATQSRTVTDGVTASNTTVTSATAAFTSADVGAGISGAGIPTNAVITVVGSATSVTISVAATATATGVALTIAGKRSAFSILEPTGGQAF